MEEIDQKQDLEENIEIELEEKSVTHVKRKSCFSVVEGK